MGSRDTLIMFDNLGKNCPLNILRPRETHVYNMLSGGGGIR